MPGRTSISSIAVTYYAPDPDDTKVGLFEGANYFKCGNYWPAFRSRMRDQFQPYCPVCRRAAPLPLRHTVWSLLSVSGRGDSPRGSLSPFAWLIPQGSRGMVANNAWIQRRFGL